MYTKSISGIIAKHGLSHHSYADDTQLYIAIEHSANIHSELLQWSGVSLTLVIG